MPVLPGIGAAAGLFAAAAAGPPAFADVTRSSSTGLTEFNVQMPATVNVGDALIVVMVWDNAPTLDTDGLASSLGFTLVGPTANGSAFMLAVWLKMADGSEDSRSAALTFNVAVRAVWHLYRVSGGQAVEVATAATGTSVSPDPPNLTPSWGAAENLWIVAEGCDDQNGDVTAYPTNYTTNGIYDEIAAANGVGLGSSYRIVNAASEDAGVFTIANSQEWIATTIAVRPL